MVFAYFQSSGVKTGAVIIGGKTTYASQPHAMWQYGSRTARVCSVGTARWRGSTWMEKHSSEYSFSEIRSEPRSVSTIPFHAPPNACHSELVASSEGSRVCTPSATYQSGSCLSRVICRSAASSLRLNWRQVVAKLRTVDSHVVAP